MKQNSWFNLSGSRPSVIGTGLVALDIVYNQNQEEPIGRWAGGTCGNVLSILSWLGWSASPIARLKPGREASAVLSDLKKWGVNLEFVTEEEAGSTPIILQYICNNGNGEIFHRFKMRCPVCGNRLPGFRPITSSAVTDMKSGLPDADVFYFDRTSRGILDLAAHYYDEGAVIFFEPSGIGEQRHFDEALEMAHVVKFSDDRFSVSELALPCTYPSLYIETKGRSGLRYCCRFERYRTRSWEDMLAFDLPVVRDAAGAGDWCAAGLIYQLAHGGVDDFKRQRKDQVLSAIHFGQALSAWNCRYEGARGGMYASSKNAFVQEVAEILDGNSRSNPPTRVPTRTAEEFSCTACQET